MKHEKEYYCWNIIGGILLKENFEFGTERQKVVRRIYMMEFIRIYEMENVAIKSS